MNNNERSIIDEEVNIVRNIKNTGWDVINARTDVRHHMGLCADLDETVTKCGILDYVIMNIEEVMISLTKILKLKEAI